MPRVTDRIGRQIAAEFNSTSYGERTAVVRRWTELLNCSIPAIYRIARRYGWSSYRKQRKDAGSSKVGITDEFLLLLAREKRHAKRTFGTEDKIIMDTETAIKLVRDNYNIEVNSSVSTVDRHLRRLGLDRSGLTTKAPYTALRSSNPNHVHQVDISVCLAYGFEGNFMRIRSINMQLQQNNIEEIQRIKQKILRFVLIDHYSGAFFIKYVSAEGESQTDYIDFLWEAWSDKGNPGFPFCGIPRYLIADRGSAINSKALNNFYEALNIEFITHMPGNPRAKGMVEGLMKIIQMKFESQLARHRPSCIEELNIYAFLWAKDYQANAKHSRHGRSRFLMWCENIRDMQLRTPPELDAFRSLAMCEPEIRVVRDGYIKWKSPNNRPNVFIGDFAPNGTKVQVSPDLWDKRLLYIRSNRECMGARIPEIDEAGFPIDAPVIGEGYKRKPDPISLRKVKEAERMPQPDPKPLQLPSNAHLKYERPRSIPAVIEDKDPLVSTASVLSWVADKLGRPLEPYEFNSARRRFGPRINKSRCNEVLEFINAKEQEDQK